MLSRTAATHPPSHPLPARETVDGHLGQPEKSAEHCHLTLQRQLRFKAYNDFDFILTLASLLVSTNTAATAPYSVVYATLLGISALIGAKCSVFRR